MRIVPLVVLGWLSLSTPEVFAQEPDAGPAVQVRQPPAPRPLDAKQSRLVVRTFKEGIASGFAHNHVIRATDVEGEVAFSADDPAATRLRISVKTATLEVDDPALRKAFGEAEPVNDGDRKKVDENMKAAGQLDAQKFPTVAFASTAVKAAQGGKFIVVGDLTLHGVTRRITLPVTVSQEGSVLTGDGKVTLRTSDYGIAPYSAALGMVRNKDDVELVLHLVTQP